MSGYNNATDDNFLNDHWYFIYSFLRLGKEGTYEKVALPVREDGEPVNIYINASVISLPSIDTNDLRFTVDFYLKLRWKDERVNYQDLNNRTTQNQLTLSERNALWVPKLTFINAMTQFETGVDKSTTGTVVRLGKPGKGIDMTLAREGLYFVWNF